MVVLLLPVLSPTAGRLPPMAATTASARPARPSDVLSPLGRVTAVSGGLYQTLVLTSTGAVLASGWNIVGQLCDGSTNSSNVPLSARLPPGTKVIGLAAGFAHSLALTSTGAVLACGKNYDGELGDGTTTDSAVPAKVDLPAGTMATAVAAGGGHSLAVTSTGAVLAWGLGNAGQLGNAGSGSSDLPVNVSLPAGTKATAVAAGALHSLALTSTGAVFAWGYNADGELGDGHTANSDTPVKVKLPAGTRVTALAAGGSLTGVGEIVAGPAHSLALTSTGAVFAWGYNADGELGDGHTANSDRPVRVKLPAGSRVTALAAGETHSLAVTSAGAVLAWGGNNFGQLGDGSYRESWLPLKMTLPKSTAGTASPLESAKSQLATLQQVTPASSTVFAGYNFANYIAVPGAVSAVIVVPTLDCRATPAAGRSMYVGVGIQSVNSYARLKLACTPQRLARYYPSLLVNGNAKDVPSAVAHPGDKVEFAVSQSVSQVTVSVIDMTHGFVTTSNGGGSGTSGGIMAGDFASGAASGVPDFGTLVFSSALINGYPFGSAAPGLQADSLATISGILEVKATYSASSKEAFSTVFRHA